MNLEIRDYISATAIVLSVVSLFVAIRSARFNRRVKGLELRAQVLIKFAEAKIEAENVRSYYLSIQREAESRGDLALFKLVNLDSHADSLIATLEKRYEELQKTTSEQGVSLFEDFLHVTHDAVNGVRDLKARAERRVAEYRARTTAAGLLEQPALPPSGGSSDKKP